MKILSKKDMKNELHRVDGDPLQLVLSLTQRYGDVVPYESIYGPTYLFNHPDHVARVLTHPNYRRASNYPFKIVLGEGMLSSEGSSWRSHRRLVQPEFHRERLASIGLLITEATATLLTRWQTFAANRQPFDIMPEMAQLMFDIVNRALFGNCIHEEAAELNQLIPSLIGDMSGLVNTQFALPLLFSSERTQRFKDNLQKADRLVFSIIERRRREPQKRDDLLSLLMEVRYEGTEEGLSERQLRDEIITILFAGSESSGLMLSWAWHLLAEHPEIEARLHQEIEQVSSTRVLALEDLPNLPYGRMILEEALRLRPTVWSIFRQAVADDEIAGYRIKAKSAIVVSAYAMHRDPRFWDNPQQFTPERFAADGAPSRPRYSYFPFGGGQHLCIGNNLALMEGQMAMTLIAQRFHLRSVPGYPAVPLAGVTLRPKNGIMMMLEPRTTGHANASTRAA